MIMLRDDDVPFVLGRQASGVISRFFQEPVWGIAIAAMRGVIEQCKAKSGLTGTD
jgi:hypothetical protein